MKKPRSIRLSDAVRATGLHLVVVARPASHPDKLGRASRPADVVALRGRRLAARRDSWTLAYSASHEIAELCHRFKHSETMFCHQANILADWHKLRSGMPTPFLRVDHLVEEPAPAKKRKAKRGAKR